MAQMITADLNAVQVDLQTVQKDLSGGASKTQPGPDLQALDAALIRLVRDEARFQADALADLGGARHHGDDGDGLFGWS